MSQTKPIPRHDLCKLCFDTCCTQRTFEKQIRYSIKSEFINNSEENCINIEFDNFNYKDLTITEAVVCDLNGVERIIKLSFIKGQIQDI